MDGKEQKKALWMEVIGEEPALEAPDRLEVALEYCEKLEISDLFLQVVRSGSSWIAQSNLLNLEPYERSLQAHGGADAVKKVFEWGKARNVRVHLWCNIFCMGEQRPDALIEKLGEEVLLVDSYRRLPAEDDTKSLTLDAPAYWFDPASEALKDFYLQLFSEIAGEYPEAAGIHLDFFRYPYYLPIRPSSAVRVGSDLGYGTRALERFTEESGISDPFLQEDGQFLPRNYDTALLWDAWRRQQVTDYLGIVRGVLRADQQLSVACIAWPDRAYLSSFQNWRQWLIEEKVDIAAPMMYTADQEMFSHLLRQACAFQTERSEVMAGIGAYIFTQKESLEKQLQEVGHSQASGYALFSYRNLKRSQLI